MKAWSVRKHCSGSCLRDRRNSRPFVRLPLPRQQFLQIGDAGERIGELRLWVDVVETASRDDREHDGGTIGPALGTREGPVAAPECNSSQSALGRIVRETNPAIFEETGKAIPALQHVIDRLDHLRRFAERGALPFQPERSFPRALTCPM